MTVQPKKDSARSERISASVRPLRKSCSHVRYVLQVHLDVSEFSFPRKTSHITLLKILMQNPQITWMLFKFIKVLQTWKWKFASFTFLSALSPTASIAAWTSIYSTFHIIYYAWCCFCQKTNSKMNSKLKPEEIVSSFF